MFSAAIKFDAGVEAPTVIYMHKDDANPETTWYPHGYDLSVESHYVRAPLADIEWIEPAGHNYASFVIKNKDFDGKWVTVTVTPKSSSDDGFSKELI